MSLSAQELVKNPAFSTDKKITTTNQISKSEGWSNANGATVDLFNSDACKYEVGVPNNYMGEQASSSNYAGIIAYYDNQRLSYVKFVKLLSIFTLTQEVRLLKLNLIQI